VELEIKTKKRQDLIKCSLNRLFAKAGNSFGNSRDDLRKIEAEKLFSGWILRSLDGTDGKDISRAVLGARVISKMRYNLEVMLGIKGE